jgi:hypothetical protein
MEHDSQHIAKEKVTVGGGRDTKGGAPVQKDYGGSVVCK